jgi:hypothetical protein
MLISLILFFGTVLQITMMKVVFAILLLFLSAGHGNQEGTTKPRKVGPPFFLIDTSDQLCLAGEEFKRCAIDTLFFVVGLPGEFRRTIVFSVEMQVFIDLYIVMLCFVSFQGAIKLRKDQSMEKLTTRKMALVLL